VEDRSQESTAGLPDFVLVQCTNLGKLMPKDLKNNQIAVKYQIRLKMAIYMYTKNLYPKTLKNLPKLGFFLSNPGQPTMKEPGQVCGDTISGPATLWKNLGFCTFSLENVLFYLDIPNELFTKNVIFPETFLMNH
jgi:hypothetical protein